MDIYKNESDRLAEREALLKATIDSSMDMIQVFVAVRDDRGEIVDFVWILNNKASERIYGDVIGKSLLTLNPGVVQEGIFDTFKRVVESGEPDQSIRHYVHEQFDGWFHQSTVKQNDGVATTTRDITEAKEVMQSIKDSQTFLQAVIDSSLDIIQVFEAVRDTEGRIVDFTWKVQNSKGLQQNGEVIGERLLARNPGVISSGIFDRMVYVTETGIASEEEQYYAYEQFNEQWFYQALVKQGDGVLMTTRDITLEKKAKLGILHLKDEIAQKATDKYLTLFNNMEQGFCIIEMIFDDTGVAVDYRFLEVNPVFEKQTDIKNAVGRTMKELRPAHEAHWFRIYGDVVKTGKSAHFENEAAHLAGGVWYETFAIPFGRPENHQVAIFFNDITERKRTEERRSYLLQLSDALRSLTDPLDIQATACRLLCEHFNVERVIYADIEGDEYNVKCSHLRGSGNVTGSASIPVFSGRLLEEYRQNGTIAIDDTATDPRLDEEIRIDYAALSIAAVAGAMLIKNDQWIASCTIYAATPRKWTATELILLKETAERIWEAVEKAKIGAAIRESENRLTSMFQALPVAAGFVDHAGKLIFANEEMSRYLPTNVIPSQDEQRYWRWVAYDSDGQEISRADYPGARALRGEYVVPGIEMRYTQDDKTYAWVRVAAVPFRDGDDRIIGAVSVISDITQLKQTTDKLHRLINMQEDFISIASHELKTPVTSIKTYAEIVAESLQEQGDMENAVLVSKLSNQVDRLTNLIRDLLDTTRIEQGQLIYEKEVFKLNELLAERVDEMRHTAANRKITLQLEEPSGIIADRERIGQVIINLVSNAIKYAPNNTEIMIRSTSDGSEIKVSVADQGIGIPQDSLDKIFERFYRVGRGSVNTYPGMGLGLYISAEIIRNHGGRISVVSEEGKGSVFEFTLPLKDSI